MNMLTAAQIAALLATPAAYAGIGSRETPADVCADMSRIAHALETIGWTLRSGGAGGADLAFENGTSLASLREIYVPWKGFNGSSSPFYPQAGDRAVTARAEEIASAAHPAWERCSQGAKRLHTRNVHQVLGLKLDDPVAVVICWTSDGRASGGTGQAIRIATAHGIPVLNLHDRSVREAVLAALGLGAPTSPVANGERRPPFGISQVRRQHPDGSTTVERNGVEIEPQNPQDDQTWPTKGFGRR